MPSFTLAAGLLALAASATSASSHYSHPRDLQLAAHGNRMMPRVLPRTGRRIVSRANEATLKCLTDYTFALCDGANCTDMGSVAAGTKCVDNAITWDTSSEASTQDSSAASAGLGSVPIPVAVPASISTPAAAPAAASSSDAATTVNKATGVQLNVNSNSGSTDSSSSDDDYVCDDDTTTSSTDHRLSYWQKMAAENAGNSATQQTSADVQSVETPVATPTGAAATAIFSSASPAETTLAAAATTTTTEAVQLFASATTTSSAPAQTTSAAASSGPGGNQVYDGKATYYYQYGVAGSCGVYNSDSTFIVALSYQIVDNGAHCGQKVHIKNTANGKEITATVADTCPSCETSHLDLSEGAFLALGDLSSGVLPIEWYFEGSAAARAR